VEQNLFSSKCLLFVYRSAPARWRDHQPTRYPFTVNLKTATATGIEVRLQGANSQNSALAPELPPVAVVAVSGDRSSMYFIASPPV
jgi:hypothetical protein